MSLNFRFERIGHVQLEHLRNINATSVIIFTSYNIAKFCFHSPWMSFKIEIMMCRLLATCIFLCSFNCSEIGVRIPSKTVVKSVAFWEQACDQMFFYLLVVLEVLSVSVLCGEHWFSLVQAKRGIFGNQFYWKIEHRKQSTHHLCSENIVRIKCIQQVYATLSSAIFKQAQGEAEKFWKMISTS